MYYNIILIGAGNLGSRHLQGLALVKHRLKIFVVDVSDTNLELANERYKSVDNGARHEVVFFKSLSDIDEKNFEIAIIATNADIRFEISKDLLNLKAVKYLVLEKVLFQKEKDYDDFLIISTNYDTKIFVNCARRLNHYYQKLSNVDFGSKNIIMEVAGSSWSMGCNSIHFIDLFNFLTGFYPEKWENKLDNKVIKSKRSGFFEFTGELISNDIHGNQLRLVSDKKINSTLLIKIFSEKINYTIDEDSNKVIIEGEKFSKNDIIQIDFQSNLTNKIVESLIDFNTCNLPTYEVSSRLHKPLIKVMKDHFNNVNNSNLKYCPIT